MIDNPWKKTVRVSISVDDEGYKAYLSLLDVDSVRNLLKSKEQSEEYECCQLIKEYLEDEKQN